MKTLPLPTVREISLDELLAALPASYQLKVNVARARCGGDVTLSDLRALLGSEKTRTSSGTART